MKLLANKVGPSLSDDGQFFHAVTIQAEEPDEPELLVAALEDLPDLVWCHSAYRIDQPNIYDLPDVYLVMFHAWLDLSAAVPALCHEVEALIIGATA